MLVCEVVFGDLSKFVDGSEIEIPLLSTVEDSLSLGGRKEFAVLVEEFQRIPLTRVMGGGKDDSSVRSAHRDGQFGRRRAGKAALHDIDATADEGPADELFDHLSGYTGISPHDDLVAAIGLGFGAAVPKTFAVSIGEVYDIDGSKSLALRTADSSADSGN